MEEDGYTRYRGSWIAILRRQSLAKGLRYIVVASLVLSWLDMMPRPPLQLLAIALAAVSLSTQLLIRCPRCRAWWPLGSDDDGQRKPCARCRLHWGQEDEPTDVT